MARHRTVQPELFTTGLGMASPIPRAAEQEVRQMVAALLLAVARNQSIAVQSPEVSDEQDHA
jgi:predicted amidohydrolase